MQLILPQGDDLRKYSYFFDDAANTDFTTVSGLLGVLRNVRATPKSIDGDSVVLHEMMGVVDAPSGGAQNLYLTRIGFVGDMPDFSSDKNFINTFVPTIIGTGPRTRNADNVDHPVANGVSGQIVFPFNGSVFKQGMTCLCPTKVGPNNIGTVTYGFTSMSSYIGSASTQSSGGIYQRRYDLRTDASPVESLTALMTYTSSESRTGKGLNFSQKQSAFTVGFAWAPWVTGGEARVGVPTRNNTTEPNVPLLFASLTAEADIVLTKGLVVVSAGDSLRVIKLSASDFSFPATTPGKVASGTFPALSNIVSDQRQFVL